MCLFLSSILIPVLIRSKQRRKNYALLKSLRALALERVCLYFRLALRAFLLLQQFALLANIFVACSTLSFLSPRFSSNLQCALKPASYTHVAVRQRPFEELRGVCGTVEIVVVEEELQQGRGLPQLRWNSPNERTQETNRQLDSELKTRQQLIHTTKRHCQCKSTHARAHTRKVGCR